MITRRELLALCHCSHEDLCRVRWPAWHVDHNILVLVPSPGGTTVDDRGGGSGRALVSLGVCAWTECWTVYGLCCGAVSDERKMSAENVWGARWGERPRRTSALETTRDAHGSAVVQLTAVRLRGCTQYLGPWTTVGTDRSTAQYRHTYHDVLSGP